MEKKDMAKKKIFYIYFIGYVQIVNQAPKFSNTIIQSGLKVSNKDDISFITELIQKNSSDKEPVTIMGVNLLDTIETTDKPNG